MQICRVSKVHSKTYRVLTIFLLLLISFNLVPIPTPVPTSAISKAWWNTSWQYYRVCNINTNGYSGYYQMKINVSYNGGGDVSCNGHCQSDFDDIRFVDIDNSTVLPHWKEKYVDSQYAIFWVNVSADAMSDGKILMYYGNPSATDVSDGDETFIEFASWENSLEGWSDASQGTGTASFVDSSEITPIHGSYSLKLQGTAGNRGIVELDGLNINGDVRLLYWVATPGGSQRWYTLAMDDSDLRFTAIRTETIEYDGLECMSGTNHITLVDAMGAYEYHRVYVEIDMSANTYNVDIDDGTATANNNNFRDAGTSDIFDKITLIAADSGSAGTLYVDAFCVMKGAVGNEPTWSTFSDEHTQSANAPPTVSNPNPPDGATDIPTTLSQLSVTVEDPDGDLMNWTIETSPDVGSSSGTDDTNGTKTCSVSGLQPHTTYTWYVNVTDGTSWTNKTYTFTTLNSPPAISNPSPANESTGVSLQPTCSIYVTDDDDDVMTVRFYERKYTLGGLSYNSSIFSYASQGVAMDDKYFYGIFGKGILITNISTEKSIKSAFQYDADSDSYSDYTDEINTLPNNDIELLPPSPAIGDAFYFGLYNKFTALYINIGTAGADITITWKYWNGESWANLPSVTDNTNSFTTSGINWVYWSRPSDWQQNTVNGVTAYWVKAEVTSVGTSPTQPKAYYALSGRYCANDGTCTEHLSDGHVLQHGGEYYLYIAGCNYPSTPKSGAVYKYKLASDPDEPLDYVGVVKDFTSENCPGYLSGVDKYEVNGTTYWWITFDVASASSSNPSQVWRYDYNPSDDTDWANKVVYDLGYYHSGYNIQGFTWWEDNAGNKYIFCPIHEGSSPATIDVYKWNGDGFDNYAQYSYIQSPDGDKSSQGVCRDFSGGDYLYFASRQGDYGWPILKADIQYEISWQLQQTNESVTSGTTVSWNYANATEYETTYYWKVEVTDGIDTVSEVYHFTTMSSNNAPTLSNPSATPSSGVAEYTVFYFNITYSDPNSDPPAEIRVNISKTGWYINETMTYISGDNTTGALYSYSTTLPAGTYDYLFYANDGTYSTVNNPTDQVTVEAQSYSFTVSTADPSGQENFTASATMGAEWNVSASYQTSSIPAIQITNTGNVPINISINLTSTPISNVHIKYNTSSTPPSFTQNPYYCDKELTTTPVTVLTIEVGGTGDIWLWADFENKTNPGSYTTKLYIASSFGG